MHDLSTVLLILCLLLTACNSVRVIESKPSPVDVTPTIDLDSLRTITLLSPSPPAEVQMPFVLSSPSFTEGNPIPVDFSCQGRDTSPALTWGDPPDGTLSLALIMDDPDAPGGTWVHWVLFNLPPSMRALPEDVPQDATLVDGSRQGGNSWGNLGYGGPCPPYGTHRYFFKLYALDIVLDLAAGTGKSAVERAMQGHILGQTQLMGTFSR